jgi:cytochrome c-type biogenesis protein CcmH/NrfF
MNNLQKLFAQAKAFSKTEQAQQIIDGAAKSPGDAVQEEIRQRMRSADAKDRIPVESERHLSNIAKNTSETVTHGRATNTILSRGVGKFAWFVEKQPPVWLLWISVAFAGIGVVLAGISLWVSCARR